MTDETALEEIESIAKVFAYEQRMKEYTSPLQPRHQRNKPIFMHEKKTGEDFKATLPFQPHVHVKGLC
ncbi:MAG: hypothetical protein JXA00_03265 [Candidatus Thermoplasmatota archaeon]|nr:hypothetical protein [Candidatus Thermoplasmatota archaeon]